MSASCIWEHADAIGCNRMQSDAIGCNRMQSDAIACNANADAIACTQLTLQSQRLDYPQGVSHSYDCVHKHAEAKAQAVHTQFE